MVSCPLLFPPVNTGNPPAVGTASPLDWYSLFCYP